MNKKKARKKVARRKIKTIPVYGKDTSFIISEVVEGKADPRRRMNTYAGQVVPAYVSQNGKIYDFYKRVTLRTSVNKIVKRLRAEGYKATVREVKRKIAGRSLVVDHAIYTRPKHPKASKGRG